MKTDYPEKAKKWLAQGYNVAVYENQDLSSRDVGNRVFLRVGKDSTLKTAPKRLPDTPKLIGWRYWLIHVHRGKKLKDVS